MSRKRNGIAVTVLMVVVAATFVAAEGNKRTITILDKGTVGGEVLEPGDYTVHWEGTDDKMAITLKRAGGGRVETTGKKVELKAADRAPEVIYGAAPAKNQPPPLLEIRFHKLSFALVLDQPEPSKK